ncbi:helix-turn-helix transcriptional regulator [Conexibacter sp. CPCC 206217]|uniref:ArsR/SmtB family transcription factor n=1 Tax=Conexibacter sp. CPCC 206217 TaxID=3064574 RepID=UPI002723A29A|nr:metalloregulator ArsR/SmtB family transcription factor [Conexibacter sp. CPCC 206217]MDO8211563.1 metalloregulator ArsR/SmtB family transcription factor [Conexibacter sp. CPCC 206217]
MSPELSAAGGDDRFAGAVFAALADPTRRAVVRELSRQPAATTTATALAAELPISRQAIAKHLATLAGAGLVATERAGRETRYRLTPDPLDDALRWIAECGGQWDRRLERLRRHVGG